MNFAEYKVQIAAETAMLSQIEKTAICLICCMRLSPLYSEFVRREQWGDESAFKQCRDDAIGFIRGERDSLSVTLQMLDPLIPNTEDFGSLLGSFALNAGLAHLDLINQTTDNDAAPLIDALQMCYDTIDYCVQHEIDPQYSRSVPLADIDAHVMMKREIEWQLATLRRVRGNSDLIGFVTTDFDDAKLASFMLSTIILSPNN